LTSKFTLKTRSCDTPTFGIIFQRSKSHFKVLVQLSEFLIDLFNLFVNFYLVHVVLYIIWLRKKLIRHLWDLSFCSDEDFDLVAAPFCELVLTKL
jgi:hypothetical protein